MKNTLEVECLIQSLTEYVEAKRELDTSRDRCIANGGHSWDYFARHEIERVERKADEFGKRLTEFIDSRINAMTKQQEAAEAAARG